jgi:hypothetical protein
MRQFPAALANISYSSELCEKRNFTENIQGNIAMIKCASTILSLGLFLYVLKCSFSPSPLLQNSS